MMRFAKLCIAWLPAVLVAGCVPYYFDGVAATLDESSQFDVTRRDRSWGDCYYIFSKMPTVYQSTKSGYTFTVTQGPRYWPEFFLEARSPTGVELDLKGEHVESAGYRKGGDMRRLREARGTNPTHRTAKLTEVSGDYVTVEILNDSGVKLGEENLYFELVDVNCMEIDSL